MGRAFKIKGAALKALLDDARRGMPVEQLAVVHHVTTKTIQRYLRRFDKQISTEQFVVRDRLPEAVQVAAGGPVDASAAYSEVLALREVVSQLQTENLDLKVGLWKARKALGADKDVSGK